MGERIKSVLVIHGTMTSPTEKLDVNALQRMHMEKGVRSPHKDSKTAFHWIIGRLGVTTPGRRVSEPSALCGHLNDEAFSVCLVGGLKTTKEPMYTKAQLQALNHLISDLMLSHPHLHVVGHRDIYKSPLKRRDCPGFCVSTYMLVRDIYEPSKSD